MKMLLLETTCMGSGAKRNEPKDGYARTGRRMYRRLVPLSAGVYRQPPPYEARCEVVWVQASACSGVENHDERA